MGEFRDSLYRNDRAQVRVLWHRVCGIATSATLLFERQTRRPTQSTFSIGMFDKQPIRPQTSKYPWKRYLSLEYV